MIEKLEAVGWAKLIRDNEALVRQVRYLRRPAGTILIQQGDLDDSLYIVLSGRVAVVKLLGSGQHKFVRELGRGQCFGEFAALDPAPRLANVETIEDSEFAVISHADLVRVIESDGKLAMKFIVELVRRARSDDERLDSRRPAGERLRVVLEEMCAAVAPDSATVLLKTTRAELASRADADVKTISRELSKLELAGAIKRDGRALRVRRGRL